MSVLSLASDASVNVVCTSLAFGRSRHPLSPTEALVVGSVVAAIGMAQILLSLLSDKWLRHFTRDSFRGFHKGISLSRRSAVLLGVYILGFGLCCILNGRFHLGSSRTILTTLLVLFGFVFVSAIWDCCSSWLAGKSTSLTRCPHCNASLSFRLVSNMQCPSCGKLMRE
jgi:hypothetical protein